MEEKINYSRGRAVHGSAQLDAFSLWSATTFFLFHTREIFTTKKINLIYLQQGENKSEPKPAELQANVSEFLIHGKHFVICLNRGEQYPVTIHLFMFFVHCFITGELQQSNPDVH